MTINEDIIPDNDQTRARREHLDSISKLVGNVYPNKFQRSNVVAESLEGEDTITSLVRQDAIKRIVNNDAFNDALDALDAKTKRGERPTTEDIAPVNEELNKIEVRVSGRLGTPPRVMGKVAFVHLSDGRERLQIYVRRQEAQAISNDSGQLVEAEESGWQLFQLLDHGDFIGVEGFLFVTKTGELSVHVRTVQFLAKALVPMPDKMHGVNDPEIRQRQRYVDLIAASLKVDAAKDEQDEGEASATTTPPEELNTRQVFERRSKLISAMRRHLDDHGYLEVETPMLSPIASGAAARPFKTRHNALDIDLYARIAPELYLKRLVVGGFERVYELNRNFRNEGVSTRHNPEFTMLEFYTAYKDVNWMMDFCEEMLRYTVQAATGGTTVQFGEHEIDFSQPFERKTMREMIAESWKLVSRNTGSPPMLTADMLNDPVTVFFVKDTIDKLEGRNWIFGSEDLGWDNITRGILIDKDFSTITDQYRKTIPVAELTDDKTANRVEYIFDYLYGSQFKEGAKHHGLFNLRELMSKPVFIVGYPKIVSPLSKASPDNPAIAERFELFMMGMEVANGFSELNDPVEQHARFEEQAGQRERGDDEAMQMDSDYVRALSYGMPPAAGIGIGIDRLTMLLTNRRSIRDVILFPHMRPQRRDEPETEETRDEAAPR